MSLQSDIGHYMVKPNLVKNTGIDWTNNNSESINHVLKAATQWKPRKLPEMISILATQNLPGLIS